VRLVIARCSVDYDGRLTAHLPLATRLLLVKADGSVLVHSDGGSYKPLNWMSPPCSLATAVDEAGTGTWTVTNSRRDAHDHARGGPARLLPRALGVDPGLVKDGVEAHLQVLLADQVEVLMPAGGWCGEYPHGHRPGRPAVPRRRRRRRGGRDQAAGEIDGSSLTLLTCSTATARWPW
jgi:hypothetical protein